jgi:hypothetical protein
VQMRSVDERWHQTLCALVSWIRDTSIRRIVFCDNSATTCSFKAICNFAQIFGKEIEVLIFSGNAEKLCFCGKGYGEGEIVAHAFAKSHFLKEAKSFYKITGRIFIGNFEELHCQHAKDPLVFSLPGVPWKLKCKQFLLRFERIRSRFEGRSAYTVFYKSEVNFFRTHLLERYLEVDERQNRWLEHVYFLPVMQNGAVGFRKNLKVVGLRGTSGETYEGHTYPDDVVALARSMAA